MSNNKRMVIKNKNDRLLVEIVFKINDDGTYTVAHHPAPGIEDMETDDLVADNITFEDMGD